MNLPYNRISVNASLVKAIGMNESLLYEYLISSQNKGEWFLAPMALIKSRTTLSEHQQSTAFEHLCKLDLVRIKFEGFPRKRYVKIRKRGFKAIKNRLADTKNTISGEKP